MIEAAIQEPEEIEGEILTEQDLVDNVEDMMDVAVPDGMDQGWLLKALWDDLHRGEHAQAVLAEAEMARVIELNQKLDTRTVDGMGQLVARIPMSVYLHWTARYGDDFWRQKDSIDFILNRAGGGQGNPGFVVKSTMKPQVMIDGLKSSGRDVAAGGVEHQVKPAAGVGSAAVPLAEMPSANYQVPSIKCQVRGRRGRWAL